MEGDSKEWESTKLHTAAFLGPYAVAIAGAISPVLSAVAVYLVNRTLNKLDGVKKTTEEAKEDNEEFSKDLAVKLKEAEAVIRGDLANGIKTRLDSIDEKLPPKQ